MTTPVQLSIPPSIPTDADVLLGATQLLAHIETLPPDATGGLEFGLDGLILVQSRSICWAVAAGMKRRLSKLLRQQRSPPLDREFVDQVVSECRSTGRPLGEALLASGHITEEGLRTALFSHVAEAVARIAGSGVQWQDFRPHDGRGYDARFVFSTAEVLSALGARRNRALAAVARRILMDTLVTDSRGLGFVHDELGPVTIAVEGRPTLKVREIVDLCSWAWSLFDISGVFDPTIRVVTGATSEAYAVVAWRSHEVYFVAVCENRAAAALLTARADATFDVRAEASP